MEKRIDTICALVESVNISLQHRKEDKWPSREHSKTSIIRRCIVIRDEVLQLMKEVGKE